MSHVTPADVACDIAQALCDVARAAAARCCDVVRCGAPTPATFSRARGEVATSHPPWATSPHRPRAGGDVATSPRPYAMSLATLLVGRGRAITKESSMSPPPLWAPVSLVRCCDVAQAVCDVARSPRARGRSSDIAQALCDVAHDVAGAMLRCRAMWPTHPRDILSGPRRTCDIAPALSDIATSHPRSWQRSTCDIAPLPRRHRYIAKPRIRD